MTAHTNHISALIVYIIFNTFWSHPPDGNLLTVSDTLPPTEVVSTIHILCQSKISYFDHSIVVNPGSSAWDTCSEGFY